MRATSVILWAGLAIAAWWQSTAVADQIENVKVVCDRWVDATSLEVLGLDAIRLEQAQTEHEEAVAVYRWVKRMLWVGNAPQEGALLQPYVSDPMKIVNVYGYHWCDGQSRVMQCVWRALGGRAYKFFKGGHTLADIYYVDDDGIGRWHVFDLSQNWFSYGVDGAHILDAAELAQWLTPRPALMPYTPWLSSNEIYGWAHAPHYILDDVHAMVVNLRRDEQLLRRWSYAGAHYEREMDNAGQGLHDTEHGPYAADVGTGEFVLAPDFMRAGWQDDLHEPVQYATVQQIGEDTFVCAEPGRSAWLIYRIQTPYIIGSARVEGKVAVGEGGGSAVIWTSTDGGQTSHFHWMSVEPGISDFVADICPQSVGPASPFGRYEYLVYINLNSTSAQPHPTGVADLRLTTAVQQNIWALPQLWPGENSITVSADLLPADLAVRVTYHWTDASQQPRENVTVVQEIPYTYTIAADGSRWTDVVCSDLTIEAVPSDGQGSRTLVKEPNVPIVPTEVVYPGFGEAAPLELKTLQEYEADLATTSSTLKRQALAGLMYLGDPQAVPAIEQHAVYIETDPWVKLYALRALTALQGAEAAPVLLKALRWDPSLHFGAGPGDQQYKWNHVPALAATLAAQLGIREAAGDIAAILSNPLPYATYHYYTAMWACLRALGDLRDRSMINVLVSYLNSGGVYAEDDAALAARALGKIGDSTAADVLLAKFDQTPYDLTKINCAWALGKTATRGAGDRLINLLDHPDEDMRGTAAEALGLVRYLPARGILQNMAASDPFAWVRQAASQAVTRIDEYQQCDLDDSGTVDVLDAAMFVAALAGPGQPSGEPAADVDGDGDVDLADFAAFAANVIGP